MAINIESALVSAARALQGVSDSPRLDAELLLMFVLEVPRSHLFAHPDRELDRRDDARLRSLLERRLKHEPVAYLTGEKEFWSLSLKVTPETLVPRPETEQLVEAALALILPNANVTVLDLGTGSGAIAIAISSERPQCRIVATDRSASALSVATANAARHELTNISFQQGDWLEAVTGKTFDIIVSNPPYIASDDKALERLPCEPRNALASGKHGLDAIRRIAADSGRHLISGGTLLLEHGADQQESVAQILADQNWRSIQCLSDLCGLPRVTRARWKSPGESEVR